MSRAYPASRPSTSGASPADAVSFESASAPLETLARALARALAVARRSPSSTDGVAFSVYTMTSSSSFSSSFGSGGGGGGCGCFFGARLPEDPMGTNCPRFIAWSTAPLQIAVAIFVGAAQAEAEVHALYNGGTAGSAHHVTKLQVDAIVSQEASEGVVGGVDAASRLPRFRVAPATTWQCLRQQLIVLERTLKGAAGQPPLLHDAREDAVHVDQVIGQRAGRAAGDDATAAGAGEAGLGEGDPLVLVVEGHRGIQGSFAEVLEGDAEIHPIPRIAEGAFAAIQRDADHVALQEAVAVALQLAAVVIQGAVADVAPAVLVAAQKRCDVGLPGRDADEEVAGGGLLQDHLPAIHAGHEALRAEHGGPLLVGAVRGAEEVARHRDLRTRLVAVPGEGDAGLRLEDGRLHPRRGRRHARTDARHVSALRPQVFDLVLHGGARVHREPGEANVQLVDLTQLHLERNRRLGRRLSGRLRAPGYEHARLSDEDGFRRGDLWRLRRSQAPRRVDQHRLGVVVGNEQMEQRREVLAVEDSALAPLDIHAPGAMASQSHGAHAAHQALVQLFQRPTQLVRVGARLAESRSDVASPGREDGRQHLHRRHLQSHVSVEKQARKDASYALAKQQAVHLPPRRRRRGRQQIPHVRRQLDVGLEHRGCIAQAQSPGSPWRLQVPRVVHCQVQILDHRGHERCAQRLRLASVIRGNRQHCGGAAVFALSQARDEAERVCGRHVAVCGTFVCQVAPQDRIKQIHDSPRPSRCTVTVDQIRGLRRAAAGEPHEAKQAGHGDTFQEVSTFCAIAEHVDESAEQLQGRGSHEEDGGRPFCGGSLSDELLHLQRPRSLQHLQRRRGARACQLQVGAVESAEAAALSVLVLGWIPQKAHVAQLRHVIRHLDPAADSPEEDVAADAESLVGGRRRLDLQELQLRRMLHSQSWRRWHAKVVLREALRHAFLIKAVALAERRRTEWMRQHRVADGSPGRIRFHRDVHDRGARLFPELAFSLDGGVLDCSGRQVHGRVAAGASRLVTGVEADAG
eukprot:scaffold213_cov245-Pinguiococcus_pyrenoidosus.AAC.39